MITEIERKALLGIYKSDFRDGNDPVDFPVWSWSANPFSDKRTFSGAMSSLVKKGLARADGEGDDACVYLTQAGWDLIKGEVK